ncbi:VOC family protein [Nocardioides sp. CBS4Y-1]|uniref:2-oxoadipate dioxygenase/decarboxylase n=1 Tax=Nocardioides acrostichi TaxID=2784339 RepID=A0A930UYI1_9ACTN|nr:VOC family protein [Nocardioides acrostichi]
MFVDPTTLRARFAARLSDLYGTEVPAYTTLLTVSGEVNRRVLARDGADAERLGSIERVTAERHGAIRVGSPRELAQVARIFGALGMRPTGFYDLRDAYPRPIPVISTAFRPIDRDELAANPFRVFTSMLVPEDRRFFSADLEERLRRFIDERTLFAPEVLELADRAEAGGGLESADADRFLTLATESFALSREPVDRAWYDELERVSAVAADIGGVARTHINHLTPRVLDIDDLYVSMQARGVEMIDAIQGPPGWEGPDVLLRQTSFRALAEPRVYRETDGSLVEGTMRVRFGEVEARGIALTPAGRDIYDRAMEDQARWSEYWPATERELHDRGLAFFTYRVADEPPAGLPPEAATGVDLVAGGWLVAEPIVYEDFLPRSAAGIFASNLTGTGSTDAGQGGADRDLAWLAERIGRTINVPEELYAAQSLASLRAARERLRQVARGQA